MRASHGFLPLSFAILAAACGARSTVQQPDPAGPSTDPSTKPPPPPLPPAALYVEDGAGCAEGRPPGEAADVFASIEAGEGIAVVETFFAGECTGLGGQYVLAREVDGFRSLWLGGHGCEFFGYPPPEGLPYGVARYRQTAALFEIGPDVCVGFPDEPPGVQTDVITSAIALFERLDDAEAFAAAADAGFP